MLSFLAIVDQVYKLYFSHENVYIITGGKDDKNCLIASQCPLLNNLIHTHHNHIKHTNMSVVQTHTNYNFMKYELKRDCETPDKADFLLQK